MTGELSEESWESVMNNFQNGIAEVEPEGCAQNSMQCYVHSQAVADKVRIALIFFCKTTRYYDSKLDER